MCTRQAHFLAVIILATIVGACALCDKCHFDCKHHTGVKSLMYNPEEQSSVEVGLDDAEPCEQPKWYGYDRICGPAYLGLHRLFLYDALHCFLHCGTSVQGWN